MVGILIIAITFYFAKDMIRKNKLVMKKLEEQKQQLEKGKQAILTWQALTSEIENLTKNLFSKDTTALKAFVEHEAQVTGININSFSPSNKEKDFYWESGIIIRGNSDSYRDITKFLNNLEARNVGTESLHIKGEKDKRIIDIVLKSFVLNE
jgi:preprotein translocase subunit YajC